MAEKERWHSMDDRQMIQFSSGKGRFLHRVVGVAVSGDRVLLHRPITEDFWTMPGGRVEMGEASGKALAREMQEELGLAVQVERLLWVVETFFQHGGWAYHEIGFYYLMVFPADSHITEQEQAFTGEEQDLELIFRWFRKDDLDGLRLFPSFLKAGLKALPTTTQHLVHRGE